MNTEEIPQIEGLPQQAEGLEKLLHETGLTGDILPEIFAPGFRNTYDLSVTKSGAVYVTDNGANGGWTVSPCSHCRGN